MLGTVISHYKLVDVLGSGGMGVVYRAEDLRLGRQVALKYLPAEAARDPQLVARFVREARSASALNHPNICTIYEVDEFEGHHFITMELLEGQTLRERIAEGPVPVEIVIETAIEIADALETAHQRGIVHRDIKPANVFLTTRGEAKVLDFGLAKLDVRKLAGAVASTTAGADNDSQLTSPGQALGTVAYMSPEQARGETLDARSDLFSLGVVLYEMATGQPAFPGATSAVIFDAIFNREPARPSRFNTRISPAFDNVIAKLLEKDCRFRYQNAADLIADLRRLQRDSGLIKAPASSRTKTRKPSRAIDSLAVLPFENATGSTDLDYAGDDLAEGLIDALSPTPKLRVVPRSKAFRYRGQAEDAQHVGRELGVRAILSGRITLRGDTLLVRAELIDVAKDAQMWGAQITRASNDLLEIQEEITRLVRERLQGPSSAGSRLSKSMPARSSTGLNKEAHQLYVRATHHANKWTQEGIQYAIDLCRQAIDIDPTYPQPYAIMAQSYAVLTVVGRVDTEHAFRQAKANARKALELDETLSEAHAALGFTHVMDFNLAEALREGKRAVELNPNLGMGYYVHAQALACLGNVDQAVERIREGYEVDPLMAPVNYNYGLLLYYAHRWSEAELQMRRTLELNPSFAMAQAMLGVVLARSGKFKEALAQIQEFMKNTPEGVWELLQAYVAALAGDRDLVESIMAKHASSNRAAATYFAGTIYGALGDLDKGFVELGRARDLRFGVLSSAAVNPALEPFRKDPRWPAFLKSLNLGAEVAR